MAIEATLQTLKALLLEDPEVISLRDWAKLVIVGVVQDRSTQFFGYCFDARGEWEAAAPRNSTALELLRSVREEMRQAHPLGEAWISCLIVVTVEGRFELIPEYERADRWAIKPSNLAERIEQFRSIDITACSPRPAVQ